MMRDMKIAVWRCIATRSRKPTWSSRRYSELPARLRRGGGPWSHRKEAALHRHVLGEIGHAAVPLQLSLLEHVGAVADELGEMDVLLGEQDRQAFLLELDDRVRHLLDDDRRDALGGLVEHDEQGITHERARDGKHLLI